MPHRDWRFRIEDMLEAIARIQRHSKGLQFEGFLKDELVVDAVLRNLAVLGEASRHIPESIVAKSPEIPWASIRGMRNVLVHDYFGVDLASVWETVRNDLPPLVPLLRKLLQTY